MSSTSYVWTNPGTYRIAPSKFKWQTWNYFLQRELNCRDYEKGLKQKTGQWLTLRSFFSFADSLALGTFFFDTVPDLFEEEPVAVVTFAVYVVSPSVNVVLSTTELGISELEEAAITAEISCSRALEAFLVFKASIVEIASCSIVEVIISV